MHLDPRVRGVEVPRYLKNRPQLVLQVGLDMPVPIPDLRAADDGLVGTLAFNRSPFRCWVPWEAVFALVDDQGRAMLWPESLPDELQAEVEREMGVRAPDGLRVVEGGRDSVPPVELAPEGEETLSEVPAHGGRGLPPYLRVVK